MGFVVGTHAMAEAIAIATEHGVGLASARHSTHFGAAATYVLQAIDKKFMSLVFTNASPAMPVWGGRVPFLGSSPFAAGAPGGNNGPFVLDMATTVTARGKLRLAGQRGEPIPEGLALDAEGRPTTDGTKAAEGGVVLPFGGVKGAGISMLMEIFGGLFSGAAFAGQVANLFQDFSKPQDVGHFFLAIRPDLFMSMDAFEDRMDTLVERAKACSLAEGFDEILIPGEPESRTRERRMKTGIPVSADIVRALEAEAEAVGNSMPAAADAPPVEAV
jgi:LDH2 family malate/lactate/ureidoglycolate dehydrogenase